MKKIIFILAIGIAAWYWHQGELPFFPSQGAYDEAGNPAVWLFSSDQAQEYSETMRKQLKRRKVAFEEINVDPNELDNKNVQFWKKHGRNTVPVVVAGSEITYGTGMPELATILGLTFGEKYLTGTEKRLFKKHFNGDGSPKIVMYGADWCPSCKKLRNEFNSNSIEFVEIDVEKSTQKESIKRTMGIAGYPATWVGYKRINAVTAKPIYKALQNY